MRNAKRENDEVVILNSFVPTVLGLYIKVFVDGTDDENCVKMYEITWHIVQFLPVNQSNFEHYNAYTNPSSSCIYGTSRLEECPKYRNFLLMLHV